MREPTIEWYVIDTDPGRGVRFDWSDRCFKARCAVVRAHNEEQARWAALEEWGAGPDEIDPDSLTVYIKSEADAFINEQTVVTPWSSQKRFEERWVHGNEGR